MHAAAWFVLGLGVGAWLTPPSSELVVRVLMRRALVHPDR